MASLQTSSFRVRICRDMFSRIRKANEGSSMNFSRKNFRSTVMTRASPLERTLEARTGSLSNPGSPKKSPSPSSASLISLPSSSRNTSTLPDLITYIPSPASP